MYLHVPPLDSCIPRWNLKHPPPVNSFSGCGENHTCSNYGMSPWCGNLSAQSPSYEYKRKVLYNLTMLAVTYQCELYGNSFILKGCRSAVIYSSLVNNIGSRLWDIKNWISTSNSLWSGFERYTTSIMVHLSWNLYLYTCSWRTLSESATCRESWVRNERRSMEIDTVRCKMQSGDRLSWMFSWLVVFDKEKPCLITLVWIWSSLCMWMNSAYLLAKFS